MRCRVSHCEEDNCEETRSCARPSRTLRPQILVHSEREITIIEGGDTAEIEVEVTMPPHFICTETGNPGEVCVLKVVAEFRSHNERRCRDQDERNLIQAVIGYPGELEDAFCGLPVTMQSWDDDLVIPVRAKVLHVPAIYINIYYYVIALCVV